jgi:hypothetical protein
VVLAPHAGVKSSGGQSARPGADKALIRWATVSNNRGEHEVSRKTIARGMPGLLRCTCGDYARVLCFISHARLLLL